jgi:hypothetical protein
MKGTEYPTFPHFVKNFQALLKTQFSSLFFGRFSLQDIGVNCFKLKTLCAAVFGVFFGAIPPCETAD